MSIFRVTTPIAGPDGMILTPMSKQILMTGWMTRSFRVTGPVGMIWPLKSWMSSMTGLTMATTLTFGRVGMTSIRMQRRILMAGWMTPKTPTIGRAGKISIRMQRRISTIGRLTLIQKSTLMKRASTRRRMWMRLLTLMSKTWTWLARMGMGTNPL